MTFTGVPVDVNESHARLGRGDCVAARCLLGSNDPDMLGEDVAAGWLSS